jgi:hypothetical protein
MLTATRIKLAGLMRLVHQRTISRNLFWLFLNYRRGSLFRNILDHVWSLRLLGAPGSSLDCSTH